MRLRTYESFWLLKNGLLYTYPLLQKKIKTEIVVIGGGITGALISDALWQAGYKVVLLDKRDIGQGSTAATTSMLQYEIDVQLRELKNRIGEKEAAYCYQAGRVAINELEKLVKGYKIDCGFERKDSLYIAHNEKAATKLKEEFELRKKYKLGVKWLSAAQIKKQFGIVCFGGILSDTAASVDAYKLAHELIQRNAKKGMEVYDQTEIKNVAWSKQSVTINTVDGATVTCKKIIFCTGFETTHIFKEKLADLFYTYACVSEAHVNIPEALTNTLVWDTDAPYLYLRTTDDGRVLVGGEDTTSRFSFSQQKKKEKKAGKLKAKLQQLMPKLDFIEDFSWGGVFGSTKDGLPYIGASPEYRNALFVLGFGGNGITFSIQGRHIILDLLAGKENELANYYRFGR